MDRTPVQKYPPPPPGITTVGAKDDVRREQMEQIQKMDPKQLQAYYQQAYQQQAIPHNQFRYKGPKVPKPLGTPASFLFKIGGSGLALAGLLFGFFGFLSWLMFPIWFLIMFDQEALTIINMSILLNLGLAIVMIMMIFGFIGFMKNLGSKYSIAPLILLLITMFGFVIMALVLMEAVENYSTVQDYYDPGYSYGTYADWDGVFVGAHLITNIILGTTMILISVPFLQWKHINKMPKLSSTAGVMGIICGTLIMFTFLEIVGLIYFFGAITFFLMALAMFNIPVLDKDEWPYFVAARRQEERDTKLRDNPQLGLSYNFQGGGPQMQMQAAQISQMYMNPQGQNPFASKDPYSDIIKYAENLKQA